MYLLFQMVNPINYTFILEQTQGEGSSPSDILGNLHVGMTHRDKSKRLTITRMGAYTILVVFKSGLSFELSWWNRWPWGDVRYVKLPQKYMAGSSGIMGNTSSENDKCELFWILIHNEQSLIATSSLS